MFGQRSIFSEKGKEVENNHSLPILGALSLKSTKYKCPTN